ETLVRTLRLMSEVKVVGRRAPTVVRLRRPSTVSSAVRATKMIAIAGSTGAPGIIADILLSTGERSMPPILIVQHMASGFIGGFARWLSDHVGFPVRVAEAGMTPIRGEAYLAPDDRHLGIDRTGRLSLSTAEPEEGFRPSANHLFRSVAE